MNIDHTQITPGNTVSPTMQADVEADAKEAAWVDKLKEFSALRGHPIQRVPIFDREPLNLFALYHAVTARGGLQEVIDRKLWRQITCDLQVDPDRTDAGFRLRVHYTNFLAPFEAAERAAGTLAITPLAREHSRNLALQSTVRAKARNGTQRSPPRSPSSRRRGSGSASMSTDVTPAPLSLPALEPAGGNNGGAFNYNQSNKAVTRTTQALAQPPLTRSAVSANQRGHSNKRKLSAQDTAHIVGVDPAVKLVRLDFITLQRYLNACGITPDHVDNKAQAVELSEAQFCQTTVEDEGQTISAFLTRLRSDRDIKASMSN